jgi:hypothetical protein
VNGLLVFFSLIFWISIGYLLHFFYKKEKEAKEKAERTPMSGYSPYTPKAQDVFPELFSKKVPYLQAFLERDHFLLMRFVEKGTPVEEIYDLFAAQGHYFEGAAFAKHMNHSKVYEWYMRELLWSHLRKGAYEQAFSYAESANLWPEAYELAKMLYPQERWLKKGELALKNGYYPEAYSHFLQGNEVREAVKVAVLLKDQELLFSLTQGRQNTTIKVLILDTLEELKRPDLREELILRLKNNKVIPE